MRHDSFRVGQELRRGFLRPPRALAETFCLIATLGVMSATGAQTGRTPVTFWRDVLPILQQHCQVCHRRGEIAPMPLMTYRQVKPYARAIQEVTRKRTMPPWFADPRFGHFADDPSLTPQEIATLSAWADAGAPAGNAHDAAAASPLGARMGNPATRPGVTHAQAGENTRAWGCGLHV